MCIEEIGWATNVKLTCDQLMAQLLRLQELCHEPDGRVQRLVSSHL